MKIKSENIEWIKSDTTKLYGFVQNKLMFVVRRPQGREHTAPFVLHDIPHDIAVGCMTVLDGCNAAHEDLTMMQGKKLNSWIWKAELPRLTVR